MVTNVLAIMESSVRYAWIISGAILIPLSMFVFLSNPPQEPCEDPGSS
jgi:hypothetical protein